MYKPIFRLGSMQVSPVFFRQLSSYGIKSGNVLHRHTFGYSLACKKKYRSNSAAFSSTPQQMPTSDAPDTNLMSFFPEVVQDLTQEADLADLPEVAQRFSQMIESTVSHGPKTYLRMVLSAYKAFASPEQLTRENLRQAHILGWCLELGLTSFEITDDIFHDCATRDGKLCWFRNEDVGITAVNDAIIIESSTFVLLQHHFRQHPLYRTFLEHCQKVHSNMYIGQCLDLQGMHDGKLHLDLFTRANHEVNVKYKTAFRFTLPIKFAMMLAKVDDREIQAKAEAIMIEIGKWHQAQGDFLDYAGTPETLGRDVGKDIKDGKCTWLVVTALERASPEQRAIVERYYGSADSKDIQAIRDLYADLKIPHLYSVYEKEALKRINTQIEENFSGKPQKMFKDILEQLYRTFRL